MNVKTLHKGNNCNFLFKDKMPEFLSKHEYTRQTIFFNNPPSIVGKMAVGGCKEGDGPVGKYLDKVHCEDKIGEKTFEKAEIDMLTEAAVGAIKSSGIKKEDVDLFIAGDLLNQITSSSYVARDLGIPYAGIYSACSTMSEGLALASMMLNAGYFDNILCATVSHFATAERQYRYPLEYGCQRPPYAQWTVTGAGATMLSRGGNGPKITGATFGKVVDWGTNDLNNMGASMAPAAMSSLIAMFNDTGTEPDDFDLILTGDLGKLGSDILRKLMSEAGYPLGQNYIDCGNMVYGIDQKCYQGGSGCGCSATVVNSYVLDKVISGEYKKVAYFATGALMSAQSCYQGETIPCISHGVIIEA